MKLGIIIVYLFDSTKDDLLHLHLSSIRKFTDIPYTIYGGVSRLNFRGRRKLSKYREVKQFKIPVTNLRGGAEHAYYLDHLAEIAIQDGATHVVALLLDSFPVCPGWFGKLKAITDQTGSCIALDPCYTACLFFTREFYLHYRPSFKTSEEHSQFVQENHFIHHSGVSYLYTCHTHHLPWHLLKTSPGSSSFGAIYGGLIFHHWAAIRLSPKFQVTPRALLESHPALELKLRKWLLAKLRHFYTTKRWQQLPIRLKASIEKWQIHQPRLLELLEMKISMQETYAKLLQDPEAFFRERIEILDN